MIDSSSPVAAAVEIAASLLAADWARLGEQVRQAERAGVDSFHLDVMDGHYVRNLALTPHHIRALQPYTCLPFSIHLEVENPDWILEDLSPPGAELVIVQADTCPKAKETLALVRSRGARIGLAINPSQPLDSVRHLLPEIDVLLIMAVPPGFGGQLPHPHTPAKIASARDWVEREGLRLKIGVDGGVNPDNARQLVETGASLLIVGSGLFQAADMAAAVKAMK